MALPILDVEQNPEAARAVGCPIQLSALGVGEAMAHAASAGLRPVAEEPGIVRAGRGLRGEGDLLPRYEDRRIDGERGNGIVDGSEMNRRRTA